MSRFIPDLTTLDPVTGTHVSPGAKPLGSPLEASSFPSQATVVPVEQHPSQPEAVPNAVVYAKRRRTAVLAGLGLLAVTALLVIPYGGHTLALPGLPSAQADTAASSVPAVDLARMDLDNANGQYRATGSLAGLEPLAGGTVVFTTRGGTAVFGRSKDGQCLIYASVDGHATTVQTDATGYGCSQAGIDAAQAQLKLLMP